MLWTYDHQHVRIAKSVAHTSTVESQGQAGKRPSLRIGKNSTRLDLAGTYTQVAAASWLLWAKMGVHEDGGR